MYPYQPYSTSTYVYVMYLFSFLRAHQSPVSGLHILMQEYESKKARYVFAHSARLVKFPHSLLPDVGLSIRCCLTNRNLSQAKHNTNNVQTQGGWFAEHLHTRPNFMRPSPVVGLRIQQALMVYSIRVVQLSLDRCELSVHEYMA